MRRATDCVRYCIHAPGISIHALLAESDNRYGRPIDVQFVFLSTLSLRRATRYGRPIDVQLVFLSTLSLRRATVHYDNYNLHCVISIHALLAESDHPSAMLFNGREYFYPRSPCGERLPSKLKPPVKTHNFYPRSPCGERPGCQRPCERPTKDFYPRAPCGERPDRTGE